MVEVKGAVFRPGMYQLGGQVSSVKTLLEQCDGVTEDAFTAHAVMHRLREDRTLEVISVDVDGIMNGSAADIALKNEDVLFIPTKKEVQEEQTITIHGEVQYPGVYKYAANETLEDFVLQAGGLKETAAMVNVFVSRRVVNPMATTADSIIGESFNFSLKDGFVIEGEAGFHLMPFDEVFVRKSPGYNAQQNVTIEGEGQFQGNYTLTSSSQRLSEIIKQAGGLTKRAYPEGAKLLRQMTPEERELMETMLRTAQRNSGNDSIDVKKLLTLTTFPVAIELDKALANPGSDDDPYLREGDRIVVPRYTSTVSINGEVLYPNTVRYKAGEKADYYIDLAGGVSSAGKRSRTIIIYMNGMVAKADRKHKPRPGCQIVVPTKARRRGLGLTEWLSIGTSTASIATMIATIANLIK
jgi:protein involved in polysaccharide export with SLBB domain